MLHYIISDNHYLEKNHKIKMIKTIIAEDKKHLLFLIKEKIKLSGNQCDLNYIDKSQIIDFSTLFQHTQFNGKIDKWNTSKAEDMWGMFSYSSFNGDISNWNVSNVKDISHWNVKNVIDMESMFSDSQFTGDLSNWKPEKVEELTDFLYKCNEQKPYWQQCDTMEERQQAIKLHILNDELSKKLKKNIKNLPKIKL